MRRVLSFFFLLFLFMSQSQVLSVYAQSAGELKAEKDAGVATLEAMQVAIGSTVDKLDNKLVDGEVKEKLQEKHEEIKEYIQEVESEIQEENSSEEIEEIVEQAKKVAVLKVVAGVTPTEDIEDSIDETVASTASQKKEAFEVAKESLETSSGDYSIIVRSSYDSAKVISRFKTFDTTTKITELYEVSGKNYFEVFIDKDSIFRKEMLEDIENGVLPESFLGIEIVLPEVFSVFATDISGEDLSQTWGIEKYKTYNFFEENSGTSKNVSVGVVDTGIDYTHPDLTHVNTQKDKDFVNEDDDAIDDQGHGTHVAGTIGASLNGQGILGVNPHVDMIGLKICTSSGFCPSYAVIKALEYASVENIDILNMSLGGRGNPENHAICAAIDAYTQNGGLVIAAAGNANIPASDFIPGGCSNALTVAAINNSNERASFSNYGSKIDVAAPGTNIFSSYPVNKGSYKRLSGTSMAAPHITGLASFMVAKDSDITLSEVKTKLKAFPEAVSTDGGKNIGSAVDGVALLASYSSEVVVQEEENTEEAEEESVEIEIASNENIAEYILDFEEESVVGDEIPETIHYPLDDLTLADIDFSIQDNASGNFVPEIFELNPTIQLNEVVINNSDEASYKNENSQSFSIATDEETEESSGSGEYVQPVPIPEVIGNGPNQAEVQKIILVPDFSIPESNEGIEINSAERDIVEVIEGVTEYSQVIDASDASSIEENQIDVQNADLEVIELAQTPDPHNFTIFLNQEESGTGVSDIPLDAELGEIETITPEEYTQIEEDAGIGIQRAHGYSCDIYEGQRCVFYLYNSYGKYRKNISNPDVVNLSGYSRSIIINSGTPGRTSIELFDSRNRKKYVISVVVRAIPTVEDVTCAVKSKRECRLRFPDLESGSNVTFKSTNKNRYLQPVYDGDTKEVVIPTYRLGINLGDIPIEVFNNGYKIANLTLSITPDVPEYDCTLLIGDTCQVKLRYSALYEFDYSTGGIVSGYSSGNSDTVHMTAQAGGDELTYLRIGSTYHAAIKTKVLSADDITVPIERCDMLEVRDGVECQAEIVGASKLDYTVTTSGVVSLRTQGNTLTIKSLKVGETQVHIKYGGVTIGIIDVTVKTHAERFICRLNLEKNCRVYLGKYADRMGFQQTQGGLVDLSLGGDRGRYLYITAKQTGNLNIYVWDGKYSQYKAQIEVIITEPTRSTCTILEGGKCNLDGIGRYFNYEVLQDGNRVGRHKKDGKSYGDPRFVKVTQVSINNGPVVSYVEGIRSGKVELHIYRYSFHNDYLLHVIEIDVIQAPITATSFCETRINGSCSITLRNIGTDKYTVQFTQDGLVETTLKRDLLYMKGLQEGTFEILITNNETGVVAHRGNVLIEGRYNETVPRPKTELSETSITLDVGESKVIEITQGNSATAYRVIADYPNIEISQESNSSFRIKAKNADHKTSKVHFIDKEKEYATAKAYVSVNGDSSGGDNSGGDSGTGSSTGTGSGTLEEVNITINEIDSIFQEFSLSGSLTTNSTESENAKKQAIIDGKFSDDLIEKLENILGRLYEKIEKKSLQERISILKKINIKLKDRLGDSREKDALYNYIIYSFEGKTTEYENELFKSEFNTPFKKKYAALYTIDAKRLEADIVPQLIVKYGFSGLDNFEEQIGGIYSKDGLDFLLEKEIITPEQYGIYSDYVPTVEGLLLSLQEQGGMDELLKTYYPGEKGVDDGFKLAVEDYLTGIITSLDPRDIPQVLFGLLEGMKDVISGEYDLSDVEQSIRDTYDIFINIDVIIEGLSTYKQAKYKTYIHTTLALAVIPVGKIKLLNKIKGRGDTYTISEIKLEKKKKKDSANPCPIVSSVDGTNIASADDKKPCYNYKNAWQDKNTILRESNFSDTGKRYYGKSTSVKIYRNSDNGYYYYRDTAGVDPTKNHSHLEVFDKKYKHLGTANPGTGIIDTSDKEPERTIKNIMK